MTSCPPTHPRTLEAVRVCIGVLVVLMAACASRIPSPEAVAEELGGAVAARLAGPLRLAARGDDSGSDALARATENVVDDLVVPEGAARVIEGRWTEWYVDDDEAQFSTVFVVVPSDDDGDQYCVAVTVHSNGRVAARPEPGDPMDRCADVALIGLLESTT